MPKKGGGKKKKKVGIDEGGIMPAADKLVLMTTINQAMMQTLGSRSLHAKDALEEEKKLNIELEEAIKRYEDEENKLTEITADMTRQHRSMQEGLLDKINALNRIITDLKDQLESQRVQLENTKREKDQIIAGKEAEINEMKVKMEQIANEFADMLKQVLDKMSDKIEVVASSWENDTGIPIIRKLEEFSADKSVK